LKERGPTWKGFSSGPHTPRLFGPARNAGGRKGGWGGVFRSNFVEFRIGTKGGQFNTVACTNHDSKHQGKSIWLGGKNFTWQKVTGYKGDADLVINPISRRTDKNGHPDNSSIKISPGSNNDGGKNHIY